MNKPISLHGIESFVAVVEMGGFSAAAEKLGHSPSYVSKEIKRLETRLGVRLLNRSTRSISLTEPGQIYYHSSRQIMQDAANAELALSQLQESPSGKLRISAPVSFGITHLCQVLPEFAVQYPKIDLEVDYNERVVDLIDEGFDVAIRVGEMKDSNLVARKIMQSRGVVVASPEYLQRKGIPLKPQDLNTHDCICFSLSATPNSWEFTDSKGKNTIVNVKPRITCNSAELETTMAIRGIGVARLPLHSCSAALEQGLLISLLPEYERNDFGIYAVYPHRQLLTLKVRVFIEFLVNHLRNERISYSS